MKTTKTSHVVAWSKALHEAVENGHPAEAAHIARTAASEARVWLRHYRQIDAQRRAMDLEWSH
jgi:hypothetical protein